MAFPIKSAYKNTTIEDRWSPDRVWKELETELNNALRMGSIVSVKRVVDKARARLSWNLDDDLDDELAAIHTYAASMILYGEQFVSLPDRTMFPLINLAVPIRHRQED